jgi:hypothetical protein
MINNYQDAMVLWRAYGNPDLFITFTCNVNWLEIQKELRKDWIYKHKDKLDIITHVFISKVIDMLAFIKSGKPFGRTFESTLSFFSFLLKIATFCCYYDCFS